MSDLVWKGAAELRPFLVPVDSVVPHPQNPRRGRVSLIAESLDRFGQVRPILVNDANQQIVAGNHTTLAARELGWTHIAVVARAFASEDEARAYLLADNRLPELGDYDRDQLLVMLGEIEASGGWAGTGYTADDLEDLRAMNDAIPETEPAPFNGDFALSAEALAERAARLSAGRTYQEVGLLLVASDHAQFESDMRVLKKEWGDEGGVTHRVCRAVREEALRCNQS